MLEAISQFLATQVVHHGYLIVFLAAFLENSAFVGLVLPNETVLVLSGFYAQGSALNIPLLVGVGIVGAVLGDNLGYWIGHHGGRPLVRRLERRWRFLEQRLEQSQAYFKSHGGKTVITGRFVAIIRSFVPFTAGVGRMPYGRFFIFNLVGASIQTALLLLVGYFFGSQWPLIARILRDTSLVLLLLLVVAVALLYRRHHRKVVR